MNIVYQLNLFTSFFGFIKSSLDGNKTAKPVTDFNFNIEEIENDIIEYGYLIFYMIEEIFDNGNTEQLKNLDKILIDYFSFLKDDCFINFLQLHDTHLKNKIFNFKDIYIDLKGNIETEKIKNLCGIIEKTKGLIQSLKDNGLKILILNSNDLNQVTVDAKNLIYDHVEHNKIKNSFVFFRFILQHIIIENEKYTINDVFHYHELFKSSINIIEKSCNLKFVNLKILTNLKTSKQNFFDQNIINRILNIVGEESYDFNTDIDFYLFEKTSKDEILLELYETIKSTISNFTEIFDIFENDFTIESEFDFIYVKLGLLSQAIPKKISIILILK